MKQKSIVVEIRRCFSFLFSSFFSILDLWTLEPLPSASLTPIYSKTRHLGRRQLTQASCYFILKQPCSPRQAGYFTMKLFWWPRRARGQPGRARGPKKCENDPLALPFEYFLHSFLKRRKTLRIARKLVLSSSIRLARINMLANEGPRTKLGYDSWK